MPAKRARKRDSAQKRPPTVSAGKRSHTAKAASKPNAAAKAAAAKPRSGAIAAAATDAASLANLSAIWDQLGKARLPVEFRIPYLRPDDLLVCDFIFENLRLETSGEGAPKLLRKEPAATATLIVEFPPQSFGEEAFLDATGPEVPSNPTGQDKFKETTGAVDPKNVASPGQPLPAMPSARIRMAGHSRLAFAMPADEAELPFTIEALLDACRRWPMRLDINAVPDPPRFRLKEFGVHDRWLASVVASGGWAQATQDLVDGLGGAQAIQHSIAGAARRIATKAIESVNAGASDVAGALRHAMDEELDVLGERFAPLRDAGRRRIAAAALALTTTHAVAAHRVGASIIDKIHDFPFLPIVFGPHKPAGNVTALELPYRLILSPVPESRWHHRTAPVERNGRTELWHTRLTGSVADVGPDTATAIRALWSPDYQLENIVGIVNDLKPFRMSLDPLDREMLVKLMSGFDELDSHGHTFRPHTARSRRLALSSLGALLDAEGNWEPPAPKGVGLEEWRHIATLGRDHYVRVVYRGFLKDLRHAASLVKVTERKFESIPGTKNRVAVLRQRFFIIVREPRKHYSGAGHQFSGRNFPFTDVEILTRVTPSLRAPDLPECRLTDPGNIIYNPGTGVPHRACFWPMISPTNNFMFQIAATDVCGARVTFAMPLLFVGSEANEKPQVIAEIIKQNNLTPANPRRRASVGNATVCYAPIKPGAEGDPRLPTEELVFRAASVSGVSTDEAQFYPEIERARVGIAAIQRLLQKPDATVGVTYPDRYNTTSGGFGAGNSGELFLKLLEPFPLEFGEQVKSDALGGLATPGMAIQGLSRIMGPVAARPPANPADIEAALGDVIGNTFNPADFFQGAKILGGVDLGTILEVATSLAGADVPKLLSKQLPDKIEARFDWSTRIRKTDPLGLFVPDAGGASLMEMHGLVSAPTANPAATTFNATASIVHFKVNLFGFVTVWFDRLEFNARTGSKPDVAVDLHPGDEAIAFGGPLEFVNEIRKIIPSNGFSDPPALSVTPSGIKASYSVNIPNLSVGIFALEHLSLGAGFLLPFDGKPAEVRFNFAERQRPFSLTVSLLGGGGFFAICVGTEGVREIEAALEFGAALSINLGVASGSVEIKAGVYFHWQTASVELAGYVRLHGELSVLGLISASLTFNLQLAYLKEGGKSVVWGEATLEVEIEVLFLSFSVSVKCRREFGGSEGDPKFIELIPDQATWNDYCGAFATEAA
jgi:hypothetical protein